MTNNSYPSESFSVIIYGIRREPCVEKRVAEHTVKIISDVIGQSVSVHVHKYCQREDNVAHGGMLYANGARKTR